MAEITIIQEDGKLVGVLKFGNVEFKEDLPVLFNQLDKEKQAYWAKRVLVNLDRKAKKYRAEEKARRDKIKLAMNKVALETALAQMNAGNEAGNGR